MKKLLSIILATMLLITCFSMTGCGLKGRYEFYSMELLGVEYKKGDTIPGGEILTDEYVESMGFELCKDGIVKDLDGEVMEGQTWKKVDGGIQFDVDGVKMKLNKDGNKLIMDLLGQKIIFKKA